MSDVPQLNKTLMCILIKKLISYCKIFETNKYIYLVEWLTVRLLTLKVVPGTRQGRA